MSSTKPIFWQGSTILSVRKNKDVVLAGDGQLTEGSLILKSNVNKVRRLGDGSVVAGFTGPVADGVVLFEQLETLMRQSPHQLIRCGVDLAKFWRKDPYLTRPNDMLVIVNAAHSLVLTGTGDVFEKEDGIIGVGSGCSYALAASLALFEIEELSAIQIAEKAMNIAADLCVYTNKSLVLESV